MMYPASLDARLDRTLVALADPTRRAILERLSAGEARVTDVAEPFAISLNSVSKHIRMLERAELVRRRISGKEHLISFNRGPLDEAARWIEQHRVAWTTSLHALDRLVEVRVSHRFSASAERVFDAWLDPQKACKFLFATPHGQMVKTEIDGRVGGGFIIVERRDGEDVEHIGTYEQIERPRRLVFRLSVPKYSEDESRVTIEILPLEHGSTLTLTHEMRAREADLRGRTRDGWQRILEALAGELPLAEPSCGEGLAEHASVPAQMAPLLSALAETLELHREMLDPRDAACKKEDDAYRQLATSYRDISERLGAAAAFMVECRGLAACPHDTTAFGPRHREAFERFVRAQNQLLSILGPASERDEKMLASMSPHE
jgi:uncharacterized protein YndB with AHSA1/START domain